MTKTYLAQVLTYAGTIPFLGVALLSSFLPEFLDLNYEQIMLAYGAVIIAFIAGIHWGIYMVKDTPLNLFIHSNVAALLAWCALLLPVGETVLLLLCFGYLLWVDWRLWRGGVHEAWFWQLRLRATGIVLTALAIAYFGQYI